MVLWVPYNSDSIPVWLPRCTSPCNEGTMRVGSRGASLPEAPFSSQHARWTRVQYGTAYVPKKGG